jgi:hypothetical protein
VIDADHLRTYVATHPYLVHVTPQPNVRSILEKGLVPGSELGVTTRGGFFKTRGDHTYLIKERDIPIVDVCAEPTVIRVSLSALDPALIDPDEDIIAERYPGRVSSPPPMREMDGEHEAPGQDGARARWADSIPDFDRRSDLTELSLNEGRISYRGMIPATALTLHPVRSPTIAGFLSGLPADIRAALEDPPPTSGWRNEVQRARVIVTEMARCVLSAAGVDLDFRVADAREVRSTSDRLTKVSCELAREGRMSEAEAVRRARGVVQELASFDRHPVSDVDKAQDAAIRAADLAAVVAEIGDAERPGALEAARAALTAAASVVPGT